MCEKINSYTWLRILVFLIVLDISVTVHARTVYVNDTVVTTGYSSNHVKEHIFTSGKRQFHFIEQPELGYIIKMRKNTVSITNINAMLMQLQSFDQNRLGIVGHPQTMIVRGQFAFGKHSQTINMLSTQPQIEYIAPLFLSDGQQVAVIPEIVVYVKKRMDVKELGNLFAEVNCTIIKRLELAKSLYYLLAPEAQNANDVFISVQKLNELKSIEWAMPNIAFQPKLYGQIIPNDEYFANQWYLHNKGQSEGTPNADINAPEAWEITTGDPNVIVAILDTGIETKHPDLIINLVRGYDFCDNDDSPDPILGKSPDNAHGTACAGLIAAQANNNIGITGIAPTSKVMPIRIFWINEEDEPVWVTDSTVSEAIVWAARNGADVISISWGGLIARTVLRDAIVSVTESNGIGRNGKGCIILAASGNGAEDMIDYPAAFPEVVAVGATDVNDQHLLYSNYGPKMEIVAPSGCDSECTDYMKLWTTDMIGEEGYNDSNYPHLVSDYTDNFGGTSAACPLAAGVAALILSIDPNLTNNEVRRILLRSSLDLGPKGWDEEYGFGRIDAYAAVTMALNPKRISTLFVDDDAVNDPGPEDPNISDPLEGGSIEHPFDNIQEAIDYAVAGDTILIRAGTYVGNGKKGINFRGRTIAVRSEDDPEQCIIDCQHFGRGFCFDNNEGPDSILEGLTITNGYSDSFGGGIYCGSGSNPTIINCVLRSNSAKANGGGCYIGNNSTLTNCTFVNNSASSGGGLYTGHGDSILINCKFISNSANNGGGLYSDWGNPVLKNCTFNSNSVDESGGGIYNYHNNPTITNCIFSVNYAKYGGAMYNRFCRAISLINCTFVQNSAHNGSSLAFNSTETQLPSNLNLTNCIIWDSDNGIWNNDGSSIDITYSNIQNGQTGIYDPQEAVIWGEGNIDVNPLFAQLGYWIDVNKPEIVVELFDPNAVWINGDYHLKSNAGRWNSINKIWIYDDITSPCIDAGHPHKAVAYEPFPNGGIVNIGFYGGSTEASKSPSGIHGKYGGGTGEPKDPYLIYTAKQINEIGASQDDWNKHFRLMADVDLKEYNETLFNIIGIWKSQYNSSNVPFTGVFDGNQHTISNFEYTSKDSSAIGLFGYVDGSSAEIRNLGLIEPGIQSGIKSGDYIGVLAGYLLNGDVSDCYVQGGSIVGHANIGGLIGTNGDGGSITNCYTNCFVYGEEEIGGLVGVNTGTITNSYVSGSVFGERNCVGGLVGKGGGIISNCYSISSVSGDENIGGLVGHNNFGIITNCYSVGTVLGTFNTGGLIGLSSDGITINCFWDIKTSGQTMSDGGIGKTTAEMQTAGTFLETGWDFVDETENGTEDIWRIDEGQDYPRLSWELTVDNQ